MLLSTSQHSNPSLGEWIEEGKHYQQYATMTEITACTQIGGSWGVRFLHISQMDCSKMISPVLFCPKFTLPKTNSSHLPGFPKRKIIFQNRMFQDFMLVSGRGSWSIYDIEEIYCAVKEIVMDFPLKDSVFFWDLENQGLPKRALNISGKARLGEI